MIRGMRTFLRRDELVGVTREENEGREEVMRVSVISSTPAHPAYSLAWLLNLKGMENSLLFVVFSWCQKPATPKPTKCVLQAAFWTLQRRWGDIREGNITASLCPRKDAPSVSPLNIEQLGRHE